MFSIKSCIILLLLSLSLYADAAISLPTALGAGFSEDGNHFQFSQRAGILILPSLYGSDLHGQILMGYHYSSLDSDIQHLISAGGYMGFGSLSDFSLKGGAEVMLSPQNGIDPGIRLSLRGEIDGFLGIETAYLNVGPQEFQLLVTVDMGMILNVLMAI